MASKIELILYNIHVMANQNDLLTNYDTKCVDTLWHKICLKNKSKNMSK